MTTEQIDLENKPANDDVETDERTTTTLIFTHSHFVMRIGASALDKIQDMDDPQKRRAKLAKKVKARPDAEEIPKGAKRRESDEIVAAAEHANTRGKF